ncbi:hypothetical protein IIA79_02525, partial [bacterium]|nr:hypothetical protein [bacterium]
MRVSSKSRAVVALIALGACNAAAIGEDVDPRRGQLIVFVQSGVSPLAEQFAGEHLPGIRKLADEMNVPLRIVDAKNGVPEEITITPLIVYQNFRGRAIFQGRYTDLSRIKTFIRTSRAVVQGTDTLNRTKIPVLRIGRAVIAAPLKVAPVTGRRPDRYTEEKFIASARRQILKGFTDFRRAESIALRRTDRRFYMDFYPWLSDDGTLFLTTSLYSQFHCKKPVFSTKGKPLTGPWAKRDRLFRQAGEMLERGQAWVPFDAARELTDRMLPNRGWSNSLLNGLLSEGVLFEELIPRGDERARAVFFAYQRLGDHRRAAMLCERSGSLEALASRCQDLGADSSSAYRHSGLLEALAHQVPERWGRELHEIVPDPSLKPIQDAFLESLIGRDFNAFPAQLPLD